MPFSSGAFSLVSGNPVVTGTTISSTWANDTLEDIDTNGLTLCLLKDGTQTVTANIPMSSFKFTGLGAGSASGDSATIGGTETLSGKTLVTPAVTTALTSPSTTFALLNTGVTTLNFGGAVTTFAIGAAASATTWTGQSFSLTGANSTNNTAHTIENTSNAAAASHAYQDIKVGGTTSTGDPHTRWTIPSGTSWYAGPDNSDSDTWKLGTGTAVGTNTWISVTSAGVTTLSGATTLSAALTYGGVTLTNAVTGTGKMVLDTSPTLATPVIGAATGTSLTLSGASPQLTLGVLNTTLGAIKFFGNTSGNVTLQPAAAAGTDAAITLPATSVTLNAAGDLTGTTLAAGVTASSLTSVGTLSSLSLGTASGGDILTSVDAGTNRNVFRLINTGGDTYFGANNSTGSFVTNGSAYSTIIVSPSSDSIGIEFATGTLNTKRMSIAGTGEVTLTSALIGAATQSVFNTVSTTVNAFGAATTLSIGADTGTTTVNNALVADSLSTGSGAISGGAGSFTTGTFSGQIRKTATATTDTVGYLGSGSTTGAHVLEIDNTSGKLLVGVEGSAGGWIAAGTTAYATVLASNAGNVVQIAPNNTVAVTFSGTAGASRIDAGIRIGADSTNNLLDDASTGAGTATLYIGNAAINVTSDERLKSNIRPLEDGLSIVNALLPIEYDQDEERPWGDVRHYVGFGARHSHKIAPWSVNTQGDTGLPWKMRQEFLMGPVVRSIQQIDVRLRKLEARQ